MVVVTASGDRCLDCRVEARAAGIRLDRWLTDRLPDLSRTRLQALVEAGRVSVDGAPRKASYRLREGERVVVTIPPPSPATLVPEPVPLSIVFEDDHVLVVDKPAGMVVHPGAGRSSGTLVHALLAHAPSLAGVGGPDRPGIVHRLDKGTSGLLVVAKSQTAYLALTRQLASRSVSRRYLALVHGRILEPQGTIEAAIGRHPRDRVRMAVRPLGRGRAAITHFRVVERLGEFTYLEARLETGRTHQIRVHLASIGHPLVGDDTYRRRATPPVRDPILARLVAELGGPALHAAALGFVHPVSGEPCLFHSPLPGRIERLLWHLRTARER
jgi:23S rRNA pseudouridine1911/1915/1917 synthase